MTFVGRERKTRASDAKRKTQAVPNANVRLSEDEKTRLEHDAAAAGMNLSDWIRFCCINQATEPQVPPNGHTRTLSPEDTTRIRGIRELRQTVAARYKVAIGWVGPDGRLLHGAKKLDGTPVDDEAAA